VLLFGANLAAEKKMQTISIAADFFTQYSTIMLLACHNLKVNVICKAQEGKRASEIEGGGRERER
jgi:hypothetical protein